MIDDDNAQVFGDYHLLAQLAEGGMGTIHLARRGGFRKDIQRFCVVKKLRRALVRQADLVRRFHDEARVVVTLNHRAVCHVFDVGVVGDEHYLAMELIEGVSLRALLEAAHKQHRPIDAGVALLIIDELLEALGYAHEHKDPATGQPLHIVHRDVSPQNVMLSFHGGVKLIDFGVVTSSLKLEQTTAGFVVGKQQYMSPEQARAEATDARTDVYAVAVIAWELFTGRRFYGALQKNVVSMHLAEGSWVPSFDDVPPALRPALRHALAPEPGDRTPSCAAFAQELGDAPRAHGRALPALVQDLLPEARARLEALLRRSTEVVVPPEEVARAEGTTVTHIARSDDATPLAGRPPGEPTVRSSALRASSSSSPASSSSSPSSASSSSSTRLVLWSAGAALGAALLVLLAWGLLRGADDDAIHPPSLATSPPRPPSPQDVERGEQREGLVVVDAGGVAVAVGDVADDNGNDNDNDNDNDNGGADNGVADGGRRVTTTVAKKARPPGGVLPDLGAHLDYLARWCTARVPCARRVVAQRARLPLLDAVGLRALRQEAQGCVAACRR